MNYEEMNPVETTENPAEIKAPENVALGILGALVGAVIGGASIVLLSQLGYVAALSGVILALCTLKGYELLAKGMSTKGFVICIVLMLLTPVVADGIDWAIVIMQELEVGFVDALLVFPMLLADGSIALADYLKNLGMIYLFAVLGGFYTVKKAMKK